MHALSMNLTDKDHLTWYLDYADGLMPQVWGSRRDDNDRLHFRVNPCEHRPQSWAQELRSALTKLVDTHGTKLALFYSGGSDSEVVLRELVGLGVTPEVHTIKFSSDLNAHETQHADELCASLGIRPIIWQHDVDRYVQEEQYLDLGLRYQCTQIAYLTVLKYASQVNLPVVMGGEVYLQRHQHADGRVLSDQDWYYIYREDEDGVTYRYSIDTGHPVINEVMTYTPELLYSWLVHPTIARVANNEEYGKITILSVKRQAYESELGYELKAQSKFHGYERLTWTNVRCKNHLRSQLFRTQTAKLEYKALLAHLTSRLDGL